MLGTAIAYQVQTIAAFQCRHQYSGAGVAQAVGLYTSTSFPVQRGCDGHSWYGIYAHAAATATKIVVNGSVVLSLSTPVKNDLYQVTYDGFTIRYYVNGALAWTTQLQGAQFYINLPEWQAGSVFSNVETTVGALATPTQFIAINGATVNDTNALKQGGSAGTWDAAICSVIGYQTCHITAKINAATNNNALIGLTSTPSTFLAQTVNPQTYLQYFWNASNESMRSEQMGSVDQWFSGV